MEYLRNIKKTDKYKVHENFNISEFYCKDIDKPEQHILDFRLIDAAVYLREYYGVPVKIASSFRTPTGNILAGGVSKSLHLLGRAIDLKILFDTKEQWNKFLEDIENRSEVFYGLRKCGVTTVGIYDTFIHLDTRSKKLGYVLPNRDKAGYYLVFDYRDKKKINVEFAEEETWRKLMIYVPLGLLGWVLFLR